MIAMLLGACAEMPEGSDAAQTLGPSLQRFSAEGRISLRQGDRRDHLRFRWEHGPENDVVLLMSPLGQGLAELARDADGARLTQPNQAVITADSLPQLAQRLFGAPLPLEAMADWLRGARPALSGEVDGWRVVISETSAYRQRRLLRVIEARREDVEFKLVVDDWDVPE
ncbi:MAG: outer membrane lipoprotein LolB [Rhodocyclaceae bacterium]|jgi:outer membrane lipoprotein LolB|nr:MAG: outer membrane lipoprotein LolB [Rhodocyclaceae bacterium]TND03122.1 MAG: outer membrane lipoprotein LolB [Rhodocyclaceae bacterium]